MGLKKLKDCIDKMPAILRFMGKNVRPLVYPKKHIIFHKPIKGKYQKVKPFYDRKIDMIEEFMEKEVDPFIGKLFNFGK